MIRTQAKNATSYTRIDSPVGPLQLVADDGGVRRIDFVNGRNPVEADPQWLEDAEPFREATRQLRAYFAGELETFDLTLAPEGTPFQLSVWNRLCEIPFGETISYGELARRVGNEIWKWQQGFRPAFRQVESGSKPHAGGVMDISRWQAPKDAPPPARITITLRPRRGRGGRSGTPSGVHIAEGIGVRWRRAAALATG